MAAAAGDDGDDDIVCLDGSFFVNDDYKLTTFTFGSQVLELLCLQSASTDFDLTGQLVWPGAVLLNNYLSDHHDILRGCSVIELGSGVGVTGILSSKFCRKVVLTDHNDEVIKILERNIEIHSGTCDGSGGLAVEKLDWGNAEHLKEVLERHCGGFDLVLGADICFQQASIPLLFDTVLELLRVREGNCKFLLGYVSRVKVMDAMVIREAIGHGLAINEVAGSRSVVGNHQGLVYEITLQ